MVSVADKPETRRRAIAEATVRCAPETAAAIAAGGLVKGDAIAAARIAGVMAAKRTPDLVPLCHPLPLTSVDISIAVDVDCVRVEASVETVARTGVEMEALTAASVAALTIYDMAKSIDRGIEIDNVRLVLKEGGRSGLWRGQ